MCKNTTLFGLSCTQTKPIYAAVVVFMLPFQTQQQKVCFFRLIYRVTLLVLTHWRHCYRLEYKMIKTTREQIYAGEAVFQLIIQACAGACEHRTSYSVNKSLPSFPSLCQLNYKLAEWMSQCRAGLCKFKQSSLGSATKTSMFSVNWNKLKWR